MDKLPKGYRFVPTHEELIKFLKREPHPPFNLITEHDVYSENEPRNLFNNDETSEEEEAIHELYFFTKLKKISGKKIERTAGIGTWKGQKAAVKIYDIDANGKEVVSGFMKKFSFEGNKNGADDATRDWQFIMHEYSLPGGSDEVLCKIKRKRPNGYKEREKTKELLLNYEHSDEGERPRKKIRSGELGWIEEALIFDEPKNEEISHVAAITREELVGAPSTNCISELEALIATPMTSSLSEENTSFFEAITPEHEALIETPTMCSLSDEHTFLLEADTSELEALIETPMVCSLSEDYNSPLEANTSELKVLIETPTMCSLSDEHTFLLEADTSELEAVIETPMVCSLSEVYNSPLEANTSELKVLIETPMVSSLSEDCTSPLETATTANTVNTIEEFNETPMIYSPSSDPEALPDFLSMWDNTPSDFLW